MEEMIDSRAAALLAKCSRDAPDAPPYDTARRIPHRPLKGRPDGPTAAERRGNRRSIILEYLAGEALHGWVSIVTSARPVLCPWLPMDNLPHDVVLLILRHLPGPTHLPVIARVCKRYLQFASLAWVSHL